MSVTARGQRARARTSRRLTETLFGKQLKDRGVAKEHRRHSTVYAGIALVAKAAPPAMQMTDPQREVDAMVRAIRAGLMSRETAVASLALTWPRWTRRLRQATGQPMPPA